MKIKKESLTKDVLENIGMRIKQYRISFPMTQKELSERCGISERSLVRIEKGEDTQFSNIIKILRQFDLIENLNLLIVDPDDRPSYNVLKEKNKLRYRVRK